uniref:protein-L-isoaspartate(D-aspartate) O-methyltransferase n=1 Tax=Cacopsylla melanoneura TaxID=428564 RepID=A0A8D8VDB5_9HEMI
MRTILNLILSVIELTVFVQCKFPKDSQYDLPEGWFGDMKKEDMEKVISNENTTGPGFDEMMNKKFKAFLDHVNTLPYDDEATVDRYNTPHYPTMPVDDAILQKKLMAITDHVQPCGQETHKMVNYLIGQGYLKSVRVVEAMREVNKEDFAPMDPLNKGHYDYPIDLGYGTWMEPPYQIAGSLEYMRRLLKPGCKILEIGAGSGYMTALLALMGGHVTAIEHVPELAKRIPQNMQEGAPRVYFLNNYEVVCADGREGYPKNGPYDLIYYSASASDIPIHILEQLKPSGLLVFAKHKPNCVLGVQRLIGVHKLLNNDTSVREAIDQNVFIPPLKELKEQVARK